MTEPAFVRLGGKRAKSPALRPDAFMPTAALFIPCYIDQLYPDVGLATVEVLERYGVEVDYREAQTCCGQPMANAGCAADAAPLARKFVELFADAEYVVCPSASCTAMVRHHYHEYFAHGSAEEKKYKSLAPRVYELCEFLVDVLKVQSVEGRFPFKVGLHSSCHGVRELRLSASSERVEPRYGKVRQLLAGLDGIELTNLTRPDECCGFGGSFAVSEEAVSCMMGNDRIHDHESNGAAVIASADMSCLMHLGGLIRRQKKPLKLMHVAEIFAGRTPR